MNWILESTEKFYSFFRIFLFEENNKNPDYPNQFIYKYIKKIYYKRQKKATQHSLKIKLKKMGQNLKKTHFYFQ